MPLFDVQHQARAQRILLRALAGERLPHAYIFHGPPGVGKRMLADRLAGLLLCAERRPVAPPAGREAEFEGVPCVDACGVCEDCRTLAAGTHLDFHLIYRELHKYHPERKVRLKKGKDLSIDVIRHFLIEAAGRKPMRGRAKVFVIEEAERMSEEAQNALLKTLEEPPPTTFLVLLTRSIERLLSTTRSRCQPVPFAALPTDFVETKLRELRPDLPPDDAAYLARLAEGRMGLAVQFADDGFAEIKRAVGRELIGLSEGNFLGFAKGLLERANAYAELLRDRQRAEIRAMNEIEEPDDLDADEGDPEDDGTTEEEEIGLLDAGEARRAGIRRLLAVVAAFYSDALRRAAGAALEPVNVDQPDVIEAVASRHTPRGLVRAIRRIVEAESAVDQNANPGLTLEALAARLTELG